MPMPLEIVGLLRSTITIVWEDEHRSVYPARELRLACHCAACVEEMSGTPLLKPETVPERVQARAIRVVGQYAINIEWSDNHSTGIYRFADLRSDCPCEACAGERAQRPPAGR
jgi:ATP-binding protein involved in chromosome partitioning